MEFWTMFGHLGAPNKPKKGLLVKVLGSKMFTLRTLHLLQKFCHLAVTKVEKNVFGPFLGRFWQFRGPKKPKKGP